MEVLETPETKASNTTTPTGSAETTATARKPAPKNRPTVRMGNAELEKARQDWILKFDGPMVEKNFTCGSPLIRQMHKRTFDHIGRNVHFITVFGRILAGESSIAEAEEAIYQRISEVKISFERKIAVSKAALLDAQIDPEKTIFNKHETIKSLIVVPAQKRYLEVLQLADEALRLMNTLWLEGEITDKAKSRAELEFKQLIRQIGSTSRKMRIYLQGKINEASNKEGASSAIKKAAAEIKNDVPDHIDEDEAVDAAALAAA